MTAGLAKLLTPQGWELLAALPPYSEAQVLPLLERLKAQGVEPDLAAAALTQSRLRARAQVKFGPFADAMLFTEEGLEQATRLVVGATHAARFRQAGTSRVADLTCGIGGDSLAFAAAGLSVLATDTDETTAAFAWWNLRLFPEVAVRHADGLVVDLEAEAVDGIWADPSRRAGVRVVDPRRYQPPLSEVWQLRERMPALGVKVAPGISHGQVPPDARAVWVSVDGEVVEAGLWHGPLAPEGPGRSALLLIPTGQSVRSRLLSDDGADGVAQVQHPTAALQIGPVGEFLWEPDGAIIRAGLLQQAASELEARLIDPRIAYLTSDRLPLAGQYAKPALGGSDLVPLATGYRVLDVFGFAVKPLREYLRTRNVGRLTIKKRGIAVTPEQLRPQLKLRGEAAATVVLTRVAGKHTVLVVEPLMGTHPASESANIACDGSINE